MADDPRDAQPDFQAIVSGIPGMVYSFVLRTDGTSYFAYVSDMCRYFYGVEPEALRSSAKVAIDAIVDEDMYRFEAAIEASMRDMQRFRWSGRLETMNDRTRLVRAESMPQKHPEGVIWHGVMFEATEEAQMRRELSRAQDTVMSLSVPIIEVWEQVVCVPLQGSYDDRRAEKLTEALLSKVSSAEIRVAILDLTGITDIDTATVAHLLRITRSLGLLGAECALSGISPVVARTMISLEAASEQLRYFRALNQALRWAIGELGP